MTIGSAESPTSEATVFAQAAVAELDAILWRDIEPTGMAAHDNVNASLQDSDRQIAKELEGTDSIYIGHTNRPALERFMYEALIKGYNPKPETLAANRHNFLWDEILEFPSEHPDLARLMDKHGYGGKHATVEVPWVGAYAIPRTVLAGILETLYKRGQEYRSYGWGFPWFSDVEGES